MAFDRRVEMTDLYVADTLYLVRQIALYFIAKSNMYNNLMIIENRLLNRNTLDFQVIALLVGFVICAYAYALVPFGNLPKIPK